jgi:hypothetical protein
MAVLQRRERKATKEGGPKYLKNQARRIPPNQSTERTLQARSQRVKHIATFSDLIAACFFA